MRTENRHSSRIEKTLAAVIEHFSSQLPEGQTKEVRAEIHDVSLGGISFIARQPFDKDAVVRVTMDFGHDSGSGRKFSTDGVVRSCIAEPGGIFRVGVLLKERTGRELQTWHDAIARWRVFIA